MLYASMLVCISSTASLSHVCNNKQTNKQTNPLTLIQYTYLAQLHFRLTRTRPYTLPATLFKNFKKSLAFSNLHPSTLEYHIRNSLYQLHIDPLVDPLPRMATLPHKSRELVYRNILRTTISTLWRMELLNHAPLHLPHTNCRKASYICIACDNLQRRDLFKTAQYLRTHFDQLPPTPPPNPSHILHSISPSPCQ